MTRKEIDHTCMECLPDEDGFCSSTWAAGGLAATSSSSSFLFSFLPSFPFLPSFTFFLLSSLSSFLSCPSSFTVLSSVWIGSEEESGTTPSSSSSSSSSSAVRMGSWGSGTGSGPGLARLEPGSEDSDTGSGPRLTGEVERTTVASGPRPEEAKDVEV